MSIEAEGFGIGQPLVPLLAIPAAYLLYRYVSKGGMNRKKWIFFASRFVYICLIALALSSPYMVTEKEEYKDTISVTVLADVSGSMEVYGQENADLAERLYGSIRARMRNATGYDSVALKDFSRGNRTEIGNALYQSSLDTSKEESLIILVSDGNNNYGRRSRDVSTLLGRSGTTIFSLAPDAQKDEVYISGITGEDKVPVNSEYSFRIEVDKVGKYSSYTLRVRIGDEILPTVYSKQDNETEYFEFNTTFRNQGVYKITAEVTPQTPDLFADNNRYIKVVDVVDKPKVLLVTDYPGQSPLVQVLGKNNALTMTRSMPSNLESYAAVYLDNKQSSSLPAASVNVLSEYVSNGGGLVVVGGNNSYERGEYSENPRLEAILPVNSLKEPEKKRKEVAVVFLIDMSGSTRQNDVQKALVQNMILQLKPKDYVGIIAFNIDAYTVVDLDMLSNNIDEINDRLPRLKNTVEAGTDLFPAMDLADRMLGNISYDKKVIMISNGVASMASQKATLDKVRAMSEREVNVYTVGVLGANPRGEMILDDIDEQFLVEVAYEGGGVYFAPEYHQRLQLEFEEKEEEKEKDKYNIYVRDRSHFITRNIDMGAVESVGIKNYNDVNAKSVAQVLVTTDFRQPIVTSWRFGAGRVVCFTVDNGAATEWAKNLYIVDGGRLVSTITNWVIGDLEKRKGILIEADDIYFGEGDVDVYIKSDYPPSFFVQREYKDVEEKGYKQVDVDRYVSSFTPNETGVYYLKAASIVNEDTSGVAVNYPVEYSKLGIDYVELTAVSGLTNGTVYDESRIDELEAAALRFIEEASLKRDERKEPLREILAMLVLGLYFVDVVVRRTQDIIRLSRD